MTISIIPSLQNYYPVSEQNQENHSSYCTLQWRRGQLLVKSLGQVKQPYLPALHNEEYLVECLKHSPINLVSIDPKLGEDWLKFWAVACEKSNKPIFLRIPSNHQLSKQANSVIWWFKRLFDWIFALVLLLIISPVMLGLSLTIRLNSSASIFYYEWHVGERGKLFRAIKFRTQNMTPIEGWIRKYGLDNLPQLLNVLHGDMSLISPHCWTLEDAVNLNLEEQ